MSSQYGELWPIAAEIISLVWGTPANFNGFRVLAALLHGTVVVGVTNDSDRNQTRMWANAQRDGRPAYYRWCLLLNAAAWLTPTTTVPCQDAKPVEICRGDPNSQTDLSR